MKIAQLNYSFEDHDLQIDDDFEPEDFQEVRDLVVSTERLCDTYHALEQLEIVIKNQNISTEALNVLSTLSTAGTNLDRSYFIDNNLSLEAIASKKDGILKQLFYNLKTAYSKAADEIQYELTLFNLQRSRLEKLKRKLSSISSKNKVTIKVPNSKYTYYGNNKDKVKDMAEYLDKFKQMSNAMSNFNAQISDLAQDDLMTSWEHFKKLVTGNQAEYIHDRITSLDSTISKIISSSKLNLEEDRKNYKVYASDVMLGLSQIVAHTPAKNSYDVNDVSSMYEASRHFYIYLDRVDKIRVSTLVDGSQTMEVSYEQIQELIKNCDSLLSNADKHLKIAVKLSTYFAKYTMGAMQFLIHRSKDEYVDSASAFTKGGKILNRISAILYDSVSSGYNFSLGNVKKSLSIVEKYLDKV